LSDIPDIVHQRRTRVQGGIGAGQIRGWKPLARRQLGHQLLKVLALIGVQNAQDLTLPGTRASLNLGLFERCTKNLEGPLTPHKLPQRAKTYFLMIWNGENRRYARF